MTLRRQMAYQIAAMIAALLLISAASLWGLDALHQDFGSAIAGYRQLRHVYEIGSHITTAQTLLRLSRPEDQRALTELQSALTRLDLYAAESADLRNLQSPLRQAADQLRAAIANHPAAEPAAVIEPLNGVLMQLADHAARIRHRIEQSQHDADHRRQTTMVVLGTLSAALVAGTVVVGVLQYRGVMNPLRRLTSAAQRIAAGRFADRVIPDGHAEFAALAADFNAMAAQLDELYRNLEQKVEAKSRELVRSERLASVGFLAAGVAHEINNPIGIIAGHAEFALQQLDRQKAEDALAEARRTLAIISEESFRCKDIIARLLSLARPGEEDRRVVSLADVASDVVSLLGGLKQYAGRRLTHRADPDQNLTVIATEGELKQVVLNLAINALEAVSPETGQVKLEVTRRDNLVELAVIDNGRGMTPEVLEHIFEPFFTAKRGAGPPGTGLGLSISHAIVEAFGGRITAHSDGPGRGSRFVVQLPAAPNGKTER
jgi:signal transduction histidine kinase